MTTPRIERPEMVAAVESLGLDANKVLSMTVDHDFMTVRFVAEPMCSPENPDSWAKHQCLPVPAGALVAAAEAMHLPQPEHVSRLSLTPDSVLLESDTVSQLYRVL